MKIRNIKIENKINNLNLKDNAPSEKQKESANEITGKATDEISNANNGNNKFQIAASNENEIISQIKEKTKLDESEIKKYLKFKYKQPELKGIEDIS